MANDEAPTAQRALDMMLSAIGMRESRHEGTVTITGKDPVLASRHRFGELMAAAQAAFGMALGDIWQAKGGNAQDVTTDAEMGVHQHHAIAFMRQNGRALPFTEYGSGTAAHVGPDQREFYPTRDGHFVKIELFYPRLTDAIYTVLKCEPTQRAIETEIMKWDGAALEQAVREESGAIGVVRSYDDWFAHPVGHRLARKPVVEPIKIGESDPVRCRRASASRLRAFGSSTARTSSVVR